MANYFNLGVTCLGCAWTFVVSPLFSGKPRFEQLLKTRPEHERTNSSIINRTTSSILGWFKAAELLGLAAESSKDF